MNDLLNGHIQRRRVRCGKKNCKCTRGEMHTAFYHVWHDGGRRFQKYIRRRDVAGMRAACLAYRDLQIELRTGRAKYKRILSQYREMLRNFAQ